MKSLVEARINELVKKKEMRVNSLEATDSQGVKRKLKEDILWINDLIDWNMEIYVRLGGSFEVAA